MDYKRKDVTELSKGIKKVLAPDEEVKLYFTGEDQGVDWDLSFTEKRIIVASKESGKRRCYEMIPYRSISHYQMKGRSLYLQSNSAYSTIRGLFDSDLYFLSGNGSIYWPHEDFTDVKNRGNWESLTWADADSKPVARSKGLIKSEVHGEFENKKLKFESAEDREAVLIVLGTYTC